MNSFKMALKNIRKSSKDYGVYFFTLIIGVAVFYMFNSVGSQDFMANVLSSQSGAMKKLVRIMGVISVGVAIILGLLIVYANNFLIKRRKKEFGVYMMLGMSRKKVAGILSFETLLVGILSLVSGLVFGILGAQFLSIIVGKMFEADLSSFRFSFSMNVLIKTSVYFLVIFLVVLLFNAKTISKYELIDLLNAKKKAEKQLIGNSKVSVVLFIISVLLLCFAYYEIGFNGKNQSRIEFVMAIAFGILGNFMFFFSLAGFLPRLLKRIKGFFYDGLNSFVITQFGHNINTSAAAFSLISIMLFLAISAFSVGFSMNGYLNNRIKNSSPVDFSVEDLREPASECFAMNGISVDEFFGIYTEMPVYESKYVLIRSTVEAAMDEALNTFPNALWDSPDNVVRLSDYNKLEDIYQRDNIKLNNDEYAVICDFDILSDITDEAIKRGNTITVGDVELESGYKNCVNEYVLMSDLTALMGVIVLPDEVIDRYEADFTVVGSVLAGNYKSGNIEESDKTVSGIFVESEDSIIQYSTKTGIKENSISTSVSVVFIVLYIGIVFIITGAAVLALKILSDSMDAVEKYGILMSIGADYKMRKKALLFQVLMNFLLPLFMGLLHSVFGLIYAKGLLKAFGMNRMFGGTFSALIVMILVYGGYFFITYESCKKNVICDK